MGKMNLNKQSKRLLMLPCKACSRFIFNSFVFVCSKQRRNLHSKNSFRWAGNKEGREVCGVKRFEAKIKNLCSKILCCC